MTEFFCVNRMAAVLVLVLALIATQAAKARRIHHSGGTSGTAATTEAADPSQKANSSSAASNPTAPPSNPGLNTNIYDKSDDLMTFTDTVKLIRDLDGTMDVIFIKQKGSFQGPSDSTAQAKLADSQKNKTPVAITAETYSRQIRTVSGANDGQGKNKGSNDW